MKQEKAGGVSAEILLLTMFVQEICNSFSNTPQSNVSSTEAVIQPGGNGVLVLFLVFYKTIKL